MGLQRAGVEFDPQQRQPLSVDDMQQTALARYLQRVAAATQQGRMRHYFQWVRPECLDPAGYGAPAYLEEVRELRRRRALAELRTGVHWGREETDRLLPGLPPRPSRVCQHCAGASVEDVEHILFDCTLYDAERARWPELFVTRLPLHSFFSQPHAQEAIACFAAACRRRGREAKGMPL